VTKWNRINGYIIIPLNGKERKKRTFTLLKALLGTIKNMGVELISYESDAEGILETVDKMKVFTKIIIRPRIKARETEDKIRMILGHAEKRCLVANSMKTRMIIEPEIEVL
jgi:uncharacterized OsmC-like protein